MPAVHPRVSDTRDTTRRCDSTAHHRLAVARPSASGDSLPLPHPRSTGRQGHAPGAGDTDPRDPTPSHTFMASALPAIFLAYKKYILKHAKTKKKKML